MRASRRTVCRGIGPTVVMRKDGSPEITALRVFASGCSYMIGSCQTYDDRLKWMKRPKCSTGAVRLRQSRRLRGKRGRCDDNCRQPERGIDQRLTSVERPEKRKSPARQIRNQTEIPKFEARNQTFAVSRLRFRFFP